MDTDMKDEGANTPDILTEQDVAEALTWAEASHFPGPAVFALRLKRVCDSHELLRARLSRSEEERQALVVLLEEKTSELAETERERDGLEIVQQMARESMEAYEARLAEAQAALERAYALADEYDRRHLPELGTAIREALASSGADSGKEEPCKFCGGSGVLRRAAGDEAPVTCGECRGTGVGERQPNSGKGRTLSEEEIAVIANAVRFAPQPTAQRALALLEGERQ